MRVFCASAGGRLAFEDAESTIEAWRLEDVAYAFERVEVARARGKYVAGFVAYEAGAAFVPRQAARPASETPLVYFGVYAAPKLEAPSANSSGAFTVGPLQANVSRTRYAADVETILEAIREGDVYQVNYAVPFTFGFGGDPLALYAALNVSGSFPHAALVDDAEFALVSCSPELFLERTPERIVTKPMKGTARVNAADELDGVKNRAEHVMIVDLLRNDLHRLSDAVEVDRLFEVETYPRFLAMTSTITAEVSADLTLGAAFAAMFPCGSVTGAPKIAAMQTIAAIERRERGIFCGSIGYCAPDGTGMWNVAIRTAHIDKRTARGTLHVGGGIVADSSARSEWAEIVTKRSFFDAVSPQYALLETLIRDAHGAYAYLESHLDRISNAADDLHFDCDVVALRRALRAYRTNGPAIVRLQLERDGTFELSERAAPGLAEPVELCWASGVLDSTEPLLRYKTTWRPHYDAALAEAQEAGCFDALLCNELGEVADGARSTVFVLRGAELVTPPLASGALPGILRSRMLASGAARERRLSRDDITAAEELYVGSSVRGLVRAHISHAAHRVAEGAERARA